MSATITLTGAEAEAIARANATLNWIRADTFPWAFAQSGLIKARADDLRDSLGDYADLTTGRTGPGDLFPDLSDAATGIALDRVTEDITKRTWALGVLAQQAEDTAAAHEEGEWAA